MQVQKCGNRGVSVCEDGCRRVGVVEGSDKILDNGGKCIGGRRERHFYVVREECNRVSNPFASGCRYVARVIAIMFCRRANRVAKDTVVGPGSSLMRAFVHDQFASKWCEGVFIEVECPPELHVGG